MALPLLPLAIAAAPSFIKGVSGIFGTARGKKLARQNQFPNEAVNQNLIQNAAMAEQMSRVGTPQQQYNNQMQAIDRNQTAGVRMLNRSANPSASAASLVRQGNIASNQINAQDAQERVGNQRLAMQQRGILAGEERRIFDVNKRQRYLQNAAAAAEAIGAGRQNFNNALGELSQVGQMAIMGQGGGPQSIGEAGGFGGFFGNGRFGGTRASFPVNTNMQPRGFSGF